MVVKKYIGLLFYNYNGGGAFSVTNENHGRKIFKSGAAYFFPQKNNATHPLTSTFKYVCSQRSNNIILINTRSGCFLPPIRSDPPYGSPSSVHHSHQGHKRMVIGGGRTIKIPRSARATIGPHLPTGATPPLPPPPAKDPPASNPTTPDPSVTALYGSRLFPLMRDSFNSIGPQPPSENTLT